MTKRKEWFVATTLAVLLGLPRTTLCAQTVELIADPAFARGFLVKEGGAEERLVKWNDASTPVWQIGHHHSRSSFANTSLFSFHRNGLAFRDDYGTLVVHPTGEDVDVIVGVNASQEFGGVYRQQGDPWPHVYLSQRISSPNGHLGQDSPSLSDMEKIDFSIGVRLSYDRKNMEDGYNRMLHAAQFVLFFTIQNLNRQSKGYGDYYWFGITLYDDRHPVTSLLAMHDKSSAKKKGTEKLIYSVGVKPFTEEVVASGQWVAVRGDLLPHILAGLQESWRRGYLAASQDVSDYRIGGMHLGWEVTGLNDVAIAVKGLRATATLKGDSR